MFNLKGYELVRNFFDPKEILNESNKVINAAQKKKWKFIKVYHNIYIKDFVNIFCISFPFNNFFDAKILEKLEDINYKKKILEITRFNDIESSQIELQHNNKYNYQSSWHRDWNGISSGNIVLILFLSEEKGFKIVPKNNEAKLKNIKIIRYYRRRRLRRLRLRLSLVLPTITFDQALPIAAFILISLKSRIGVALSAATIASICIGVVPSTQFAWLSVSLALP